MDEKVNAEKEEEEKKNQRERINQEGRNIDEPPTCHLHRMQQRQIRLHSTHILYVISQWLLVFLGLLVLCCSLFFAVVVVAKLEMHSRSQQTHRRKIVIRYLPHFSSFLSTLCCQKTFYIHHVCACVFLRLKFTSLFSRLHSVSPLVLCRIKRVSIQCLTLLIHGLICFFLVFLFAFFTVNCCCCCQASIMFILCSRMKKIATEIYICRVNERRRKCMRFVSFCYSTLAPQLNHFDSFIISRFFSLFFQFVGW